MSQTVTFKGKSFYAKPWPNQIDREYEDPDSIRGGNWCVRVTLDEDSVKLFNAIGPKAKLKDGVAAFRRYEYVDYGQGEGVQPLGPPSVTGVSEGTLIGNGSDLSVQVEVYPYTFKNRPGVALRLVSVHVDNLVEYVRPVGVTENDSTPPVF